MAEKRTNVFSCPRATFSVVHNNRRKPANTSTDLPPSSPGGLESPHALAAALLWFPACLCYVILERSAIGGILRLWLTFRGGFSEVDHSMVCLGSEDESKAKVGPQRLGDATLMVEILCFHGDDGGTHCRH